MVKSGRLPIYASALGCALSRPPRFQPCALCGGRRLHIWTHPVYSVGLRCLGCRSVPVHRAVWTVFRDRFGGALDGLRVLHIGGHGALHEHLLKSCPGYVPTEYFPDVPLGAIGPNGLVCQDVRKLTYPDDTFDAVVSTEVFEHVAGYEAGFREIGRVLKPGGAHVFRVPIDHDGPTVERAREEPDGRITHLLPPAYHQDPLRAEGILVFQDFGPDIDRIITGLGTPTVLREVQLGRGEPALKVIVSTKPLGP